MRLVARALAGRDDLEAAGARPVDVLADQRRLVAPGEAVDHAGGLRLARQQRPGQRVGLDVDHDDVLAVLDGLQRVDDAGLRDAGRLDDHLDVRDARSAPAASAVTWVRALLDRVAERGRGVLLGRPAGGRELAVARADIEIGDADDVQAPRQAGLRQEHGAELAGADQADGDRLTGGFAFEQRDGGSWGDTGGAACPSPRNAGRGWRAR